MLRSEFYITYKLLELAISLLRTSVAQADISSTQAVLTLAQRSALSGWQQGPVFSLPTTSRHVRTLAHSSNWKYRICLAAGGSHSGFTTSHQLPTISAGSLHVESRSKTLSDHIFSSSLIIGSVFLMSHCQLEKHSESARLCQGRKNGPISQR